jgi:PAS domain S-box-containing protein
MHRPKILIVEQDTTTSLTLAADLRGMGYQVTDVVSDADAASDSVQRNPPDLALISLALDGGQDGLAVAEAIRRQTRLGVIFMSSTFDQAVLEKIGEEEPLGYLVKPVDSSQLRTTLCSALRTDIIRQKLQQSRQAHVESELRFHSAFFGAAVGMALLTLGGRHLQANQVLCRMLGYSEPELTGVKYQDLLHPQERELAGQGIIALVFGEISHLRGEQRLLTKNGQVVWGSVAITLASDIQDRPQYLICMVEDITRRKHALREVQRSHDHLEVMVQTRTRELEETNTALKVLLSHRDRESEEIQENISSNLQGRVMPYLRKLRTSGLSKDQRALLELIEENLAQVTSNFTRRLTSDRFGLTGRELEVASLVRDGKTSKEIANLLNVSERTVKYHRLKLRKKMGITGEKTNLRLQLQRLAATQ